MRAFTTIFLLAFLLACGQKQLILSQEELMKHVLNPENGLSASIDKEGVKLVMHYRPKDLIIHQNLSQSNRTEIDSLRKALADYEYFILGLSKEGREIESSYASDPARYNSVIQYLNSGITENIHMINERDTVDLYEALYIPHFGSSNTTSMLLIFKEGFVKDDDQIKIVFDDPIFGTGKTAFAFEVNNLTHAPNLDVLNTY
jgi:hypothetical protein